MDKRKIYLGRPPLRDLAAPFFSTLWLFLSEKTTFERPPKNGKASPLLGSTFSDDVRVSHSPDPSDVGHENALPQRGTESESIMMSALLIATFLMTFAAAREALCRLLSPEPEELPHYEKRPIRKRIGLE